MKRIKQIILVTFVALLIMTIAPISAFAFDNTGWYWPVPDSLYMSRGYFDGHQALDIISTRDTNETIVAARSGTVIATYEGCIIWNGYGQNHGPCNPVAHLTSGDQWGIKYFQEDGGTHVCNYGIGNGVVIDHGNGVFTEYSHMASVNVYVGQQVSGGTPIGTMGSYGNSTGRHLHFSIKQDAYMSGAYPKGTAVNSNAYGAEYIIYGSWNGVDNIWYSREYPSTKATLHVNATVDGTHSGILNGYGTCDVYINGNLDANDVTDYYTSWPAGTAYRVTDIKAENGYAYVGETEYTGTIGASDTNVNLPFATLGTLELKGALDSEPCDDLSGLGICDVYVNDVLAAEGVTNFSGQYPVGASYEIRNIIADEGKYYAGHAAVSGTIGVGKNTVELEFCTIPAAGAEWTEAGDLPSYVTPDAYEIQYKHTYKKEAETAPGAGWVQGAGKTVYTPTGESSDYYGLNESETHRLTYYYYFHFCGPNAGDVANYCQTGNFVHYDGIDPSTVWVEWQGPDGDDPNITAYTLRWNSSGEQAYCHSGTTCDSSYGSHGARSRAWYRMNVYQNYSKKTIYEWTRTDAVWNNTLDSTADSVRYRYRLKDASAPVFDSVEIAMVTQNCYSVYCKVSDDVGIAGVRFGTWKDSGDASEAKWATYELTDAETTFEREETIYLSDFDGERDCFYNTVIYVTDLAGNETQYAGSIRVYIPTVAHSSKKLILPAGTKIVEESAFEGDLGFGEVIVLEGVETIGSRAFAECRRLVFVQLPDSVKAIAADAFAGCSNVVLCCPPGSTAVKLAQQNGWVYITEN